MTETRKCKNCKSTFTLTYSHGRAKQFCTHDCYNKSKSVGKKFYITCKGCKKKKLMPAWRKRDYPVFCSRECIKLLWINLSCATCEKEFSVPPARRKTVKYCSKSCHGKQSIFSEKGENHPGWKGGRIVTSSGYIHIWKKDHPHCSIKGYVPEHRLVMEKHLRRYLNKNEHVHHINANRKDNRIENLQVLSPSEHRKLHIKEGINVIPYSVNPRP